jgi:hypothetical protein
MNERRLNFGVVIMASTPLRPSPLRGWLHALAGRFRTGRCW